MTRTDDQLTERQEIALAFIATCERKHIAQIRRDALAHYADIALLDPHVQAAVRNCLKYRREHGVNRPITRLRAIR